MPRSRFNEFAHGAALAAALFISAPLFAYHLVLEANPGAAFPFLSRFGTTELHVYPHGVRAESLWLNGFSRNGDRDITIENPFARTYSQMPVTGIGDAVRKLAKALPQTLAFTTPPPVLPPVAGTVHGIAAKRYRIVYGENAWIDLWTTDTLGDAPQLRAIVLQLISGISPLTAKSAARVPGVPLYVELNFSHFHKLPLVKVKTLTFDDAGEASALKPGVLYIHVPQLDSMWK